MLLVLLLLLLFELLLLLLFVLLVLALVLALVLVLAPVLMPAQGQAAQWWGERERPEHCRRPRSLRSWAAAAIAATTTATAMPQRTVAAVLRQTHHLSHLKML